MLISIKKIKYYAIFFTGKETVFNKTFTCLFLLLENKKKLPKKYYNFVI